ncbi:MAG TPA: TonB-dependent receptor [Steroidobacteraceae bacterium]|nr:TonB-dependent receptor [Steroidobacteraceae bacterium]
MRREIFHPGVVVTAFACAAPFLAQAQTTGSGAGSTASDSDSLQEVIVTAERRTADAQKTALSVSVRDGDTLAAEGKSSLAQYLEDVPGVTVPAALIGTGPNDNPGGGVVIRGVTPAVGLPGDSSVATTALYTDGVYQGLGGDYDVGQLEVLRGPQGTLYGRSATSGVVVTNTHDPVLDQWHASGTLEYGSYALQHLSGAVNVPIGDQFALRVSGNVLSQDSYWGGGSHAGAHQTDEGRAKLLYQPSDNLSLLLGFAVQGDIIGQGGPSGSLSAPDTILITQGPTAPAVTDVFRQYWAQLNWNLGFGTLTYLPALRTYDSDSPSVLNALPFFEQQIDNDYRKDQIHTEELRLASEPSSRISWIGGAWFYNRDYDYDETVIWEPSGGFSHEPHIIKTTTNVALFGETTIPIGDTMRVTAGARFDRTHTNSQQSTYTFNFSEGFCNGAPFNPPACSPTSPDWALPNNLFTYYLPAGAGVRTQNNFTYKLRLEKDLTPSNLMYVMASSGFLPGDLAVAQSRAVPSDPNSLTITAFNYDPETLHSYEVGSKNRFDDNKIQFNMAAYYYDYSGYQQTINLSPGMAPYFVVATTPARMLGAEVESVLQLTASDQLGVSAGYTHARYVDKPELFAANVAQDTIPGITPFTMQGRYDHRFLLPAGSTLNLGADALYTSNVDESALPPDTPATAGQFDQLEPYVASGGHVIGNLHLTWAAAGGKCSVTGYVRNVSNSVYKTGATASAGNPVNTTVTPSAPRIFGIVVQAGL